MKRPATPEFPFPRPPCSEAERTAGRLFAKGLGEAGVVPREQELRAPTSPLWLHLVAALLRLVAAGLVIGGFPTKAAPVALVALVVGLPGSSPGRTRLLSKIPGLGGTTVNVIGQIPGRGEPGLPPLVVCCHLDSHPTGGRALSRPAGIAALASGAGLLVLTIVAGTLGTDVNRAAGALFATLALASIAQLSAREGSRKSAGGGSEALVALLRLAALAAKRPPSRDLWLLATGAATSGSAGMSDFLVRHRDLARTAWVLELDGIGSGELVAVPASTRFPRRRAHPAFVRALAGAAMDCGDPLDLETRGRTHGDARTALAAGLPAATLTSRPGDARDTDAVQRAARIAHVLSRTIL
ncbi:MAG TPA: hypothetical protein VNE62_01100 [Actinomycetota bacterium]|nr:hypothetical protein [Actinomycetota bacterium]